MNSNSPANNIGKRNLNNISSDHEAGTLEDNRDIHDVISFKLTSPDRDQVVQGLALLCTLESQLDKTLPKNDIIGKLFSCLTSPDVLVAAEAASVVQNWVMDSDKTRIRILYAHRVLPIFLESLSRLETLLKCPNNDFQILEHWITSTLFVIMAMVEQIQAALKQLSNSRIGQLACTLFELRDHLQESTLILLIQLLIACLEDSPNKILTLQDQSTIERYAEALMAEGSNHIHLLSFWLYQIIKKSPPTTNDINKLFSLLDAGIADLEILQDLLEICTNMLTVLEEQCSIDANHLTVLVKTVDLLWNMNEESRVFNCLERCFSCIINCLLIASNLPENFRHQLWLLVIRNWLTRLQMNEDLLPRLAELARYLVSDRNGLEYNQEDDNLIKGIITRYQGNDGIVAPLVVIPAFLNSTDALWLNHQIINLFHQQRSWKTILSVAEIIEETPQLESETIKNIVNVRSQVFGSCKRQIKSLKDEGFDEGEEELQYIKSIIEKI